MFQRSLRADGIATAAPVLKECWRRLSALCEPIEKAPIPDTFSMTNTLFQRSLRADGIATSSAKRRGSARSQRFSALCEPME